MKTPEKEASNPLLRLSLGRRLTPEEKGGEVEDQVST